MVMQYAIIVKNARKKYGNNTILDGLNLNVPQGSIYGLLGASGCGKTTLLSCVIGVRKLDSGDIWVNGSKPGSKESGIPGPRVGYMPQDVSLVDEFSMIGALYFFGRINGMDDQTIEERYTLLKDLLQLPPRNRLVKNMSGGQQRRVSFAAALLHKPDLLILDEPTVGLDPVLRDNIWNYLVKITQEDGVTVIITTHYIEEAKQSNKIGLLRCGQLLAESSPSALLEQWHTDSLEEAFLNLSQLQSQNGQGNNNLISSSIQSNDFLNIHSIYSNYSMQNGCKLRSTRRKRCQALLVKNGLQFLRHPGGMIFSIIIPILELFVFYNAVGLDPKGLSISIVNQEAGICNYGRNRGNITYDENDNTCSFVDLSCRFIERINDSVLEKIYYDSFDEAKQRVIKDKSVGIMHFSKNFSVSIQDILENMLAAPDDTLLAGQVEVTLETANRQISLFVQKKLRDNFMDTYKEIMKECRISPKFVDIPVHFKTPIYGSKDQNYVTFVGPPFLLSTFFVLATSICSSVIITDRHSGVWDRSLVQGVTTAEILLTHLISQLIIVVIQVVLGMCICFLYFDVHCKGSITAAIWLVTLEGICGMSYGFFISVMCTSHALVNYASVGSFYPLILLCGMIWPIEGMPKFLRWISLGLPITVPGISLRGVLEKGISVDEPEVYTGFLVVTAWIVGFVAICLYTLKTRNA